MPEPEREDLTRRIRICLPQLSANRIHVLVCGSTLRREFFRAWEIKIPTQSIVNNGPQYGNNHQHKWLVVEWKCDYENSDYNRRNVDHRPLDSVRFPSVKVDLMGY